LGGRLFGSAAHHTSNAVLLILLLTAPGEPERPLGVKGLFA